MKAQIYLIMITFGELVIGFIVIRVKYAGIIAAITALIDSLPVFGVGTVLIPWSIVSLVIGKTALGAELAVLYVVISVVRNIMEPKIIGKQVGLHPLVTLLAMVVGVSLFGAAGVFALPIGIAVAKQLDDNGVINIIKKQENDN